MSLLIFALVIILVLAICVYIVKQLGLPDPWGNIAIAVLCLIGVCVILGKLGYLPAG